MKKAHSKEDFKHYHLARIIIKWEIIIPVLIILMSNNCKGIKF